MYQGLGPSFFNTYTSVPMNGAGGVFLDNCSILAKEQRKGSLLSSGRKLNVQLLRKIMQSRKRISWALIFCFVALILKDVFHDNVFQTNYYYWLILDHERFSSLIFLFLGLICCHSKKQCKFIRCFCS